MVLTVEFDKEADGRVIAEVVELPGVMVYGATQREALAKAQALALRVLAERLEQGSLTLDPMAVSFSTPNAA